MVVVPLTMVVATSAGFELLATVLLLLATLAALNFIEKPTHNRCAAFLGVGILLMQARYESIAAFALLIVIVAWLVRRTYRPSWGIWLVLALLPVLATPLVFLLQHSQDPKFTPEAGGRSLMAFAYLGDHALPFLAAFFDMSHDAVFPGVLGGMGMVCFVAFHAKRARRGLAAVTILPCAALTLLVLCWFYGDAREPTALRLFLPVSWLVVLGSLATFCWRAERSAWFFFALLVGGCGMRLWEVSQGQIFPELRIATLTRELDRLVERVPGDRAIRLWVGTPAQHLIVKGHAAVSAQTFKRLIESGRLPPRQHMQEVYVLETPLDAAMAPAFGKPSELLSRIPSEVIERVGGQMPITVHRLQR